MLRLPWWVWIVILVLIAVTVQEIRLRRAVAERDAIHEQQFRAVLGAIETNRQEQERDLGAMQVERARLKADVAAHGQRAAELERRTQVTGKAVERVTREAAELVAKGSADDIVRAWEALGWKLVPLPKPTP